MNKVMKMDSLEFDIKRALATSPDAQLQWHRIRDELYPKYQKEYEKGSFTTVLQRKLGKLKSSGEINKNSIGHQEVMYFIPKKNLPKIKAELDRELAHKRFDDIWNSFSPEQRKRELQNLLSQNLKTFAFTKNIIHEISTEISSMVKNQCESLILRLQNPSGGEAKYSPEEREILLQQLQHQLAELEKMEKENNATNSKLKVISENEFQVMLNLVTEFTNKVLETNFSGDWNATILSLMKKAIEEQKEKEIQNPH